MTNRLCPTMRRTGEKMANVRVEFTVDRDFVVKALAIQADYDELDLDDTRADLAMIGKAVRGMLAEHGEGAYFRVGDQAGEIDESYLEWAEEQMARVYPEWPAPHARAPRVVDVELPA